MQSMLKNTPGVFSLQQKESHQRNAAPTHKLLFKQQIKVPSSFLIFVAAAELAY